MREGGRASEGDGVLVPVFTAMFTSPQAPRTSCLARLTVSVVLLMKKRCFHTSPGQRFLFSVRLSALVVYKPNKCFISAKPSALLTAAVLKRFHSLWCHKT